LLASKDVGAMMAVIDAGVPERDKPGYLKHGLKILKAAEKIAPDNYGVLWRLARYYFWVSDDPTIPDEEKSRLGKIGWAYGDRATVANPKRVEGWFWAALDLGNYSLGIGIVTALFQGLEGKYIERLRRAESINPGYEYGNVQCAWGRFFYVMPWPKYDAKKSESHFNKAIEMNPNNVRAHVWLAELYHEEDEDEVATALLKQALAIPINYDPPDQRRYRARAKVLLSNWSKSD
jgi:tetratricopeptide (TPR) repeat protein